MRVLQLTLRNYRQFKEVNLELPARVIGIFGENGSGKSTLMESIAVACFGVKAARTDKKGIRTHGVLTDCLVDVVFEHGGRQYEVRRSLKGRGHTPEAELFVGDLTLASGVTEVDAEMQRLLHMDLAVFRASVFAEQKQLDAFSEVTAGKRKEMAMRLLGIRPVDDAIRSARAEARSTNESAEQISNAASDIAELEAGVKQADERAAELREGKQASAATLEEADKKSKTVRAAFAESDEVRQSIEKLTLRLQSKTEERDRVSQQAAKLKERADALAAAIDGAADLETELEGLADASQRVTDGERLAETAAELASVDASLGSLGSADAGPATADLAAAEEELAASRSASAEARASAGHAEKVLATEQERLERAELADPSEPCPTCGRPLGEDFSGYLRHCRAAVKEAVRTSGEAAKAMKAAERSQTKAETAVEKAKAADLAAREAAARREHLGESRDRLLATIERLSQLFPEGAPDPEMLRVRANRARELESKLAELGAQREHMAEIRDDLDSAGERVNALQAELVELAAEAEGSSFDAEKHEELAREREEADRALEDARSADREQADKLVEAEGALRELTGRLEEAKKTQERIGELRTEARYADRTARLLDGFRDHLVARVGPELSREAESVFRELTNHEYDDLRIDEENLSIRIADGDTYFPVERFSGSESDLANLALRVAISMHLSRVSQADVGLLILDEVLGALDAERKDLFVRAMGRLAQRFHQLFVITHAEQVKDQFPASIQVRRVGRRLSAAELI